MRKRLTIFLVLSLLLVSFHARHIIPEQDYRHAITTQYLSMIVMSADTGEVLCWDKLIVSKVTLPLSTSLIRYVDNVKNVFICLVLLNIHRRKSHIEYCSKKMVRAIMLQFHPRITYRLFPAFRAGYFFATKKRLHLRSLFLCTYSLSCFSSARYTLS